MATNINTKKQEVFKYVELSLGGGMVDVELDPDHYESALNTAFTKNIIMKTSKIFALVFIQYLQL